MGHHDAPGNGQSQPVATGLTVAGLVRPVKPIEEMGEFFPLQRLLDGIGHGQLEGTPLLFQPQLYFSSPVKESMGWMEREKSFSWLLAGAWKESAISSATSEMGNSMHCSLGCSSSMRER